MPDGTVPPILVKFLFTTDRLSVQVHPDDAYALAHEGRPGKSEMWYVLGAEPGATLAAGFREPVTREQLRRAALGGEIESLLRWWPVSPGQIYFLPAGTVHTLGRGICVCEIQQNSPITYRLYDYGRDRELHLEKSLDVARMEDHPGPSPDRGPVLASCAAFVVERLETAELRYEPAPDRFHLLVMLRGAGQIGREAVAPGQVWYVPAGAEPFAISSAGKALILKTYLPGVAGP